MNECVTEHNVNEEVGAENTSEENGDESDVSWHEDSSNLDEIDDDIHSEAYVDENDGGQDENVHDDANTDYGTTSDERMAMGSKDEEDKNAFVEFNENVVMTTSKFKLGMLFANGPIIRTAVRTYAIRHRRPIMRLNNMDTRYNMCVVMVATGKFMLVSVC